MLTTRLRTRYIFHTTSSWLSCLKVSTRPTSCTCTNVLLGTVPVANHLPGVHRVASFHESGAQGRNTWQCRAHLEATAAHELLEGGQQLIVVVDVPQATPVRERGVAVTYCLPDVVRLLVSTIPTRGHKNELGPTSSQGAAVGASIVRPVLLHAVEPAIMDRTAA